MSAKGTDQSRLILKALSGAQSGVEVALPDGEYTLGSSQDDDLQFVDVCLKGGHARLRIEGSKIMVAGGAGSVTSRSGRVIDAGDDEWRELEPLEIIVIGSNTFAIGPEQADWSEVSLAVDPQVQAPQGGRRKRKAKAASEGFGNKARYSLAAASLAGLVFVGAGLAFGSFAVDRGFITTAQPDELAAVRKALGQFPFGKSIKIRREVDGEIFAQGYVEEPAERRALHQAVDKIGVPVNMRIWVLSSIRTQLKAAVESFDVDVSYEISPSGVVTLEGDILSQGMAERFFSYIEGEVPGISSLQNNVQTAKTYFSEVKKLAQRSRIDDTVLLRLADKRIEASGVVVTDKVDAWVGFIQSYALRYADHIALTSYVQLVNEKGEVVIDNGPTQLGRSEDRNPGAAELDLARLKSAGIGASDVFPGLVAADRTGSTGDGQVADTSDNGNGGTLPEGVQLVTLPDPDKSLPGAQGDLSNGARALLGDGQDGDAEGDALAGEVLRKWDDMANAIHVKTADVSLRRRYLALVTNPADAPDLCWTGSRLRVSDIPAVLFWLDYLSLSKTASLIDFDQGNQYLLLEAALNPERTRACASKFADSADLHFDRMSLFLDEAERNPGFIRYLVRDFVPPEIDVSGVMARDRGRFLQMRDGRKVHEGSSPNVESKLMSVGTLGALLQRDEDVTPIIYSSDLAWKMTN